MADASRDRMRTVLFHILAILVTIALYCVIVPQARTELLSDEPLGTKLVGVGVRMLCVYFCFLFVYYAIFRSRARSAEMPESGAYGGYGDENEPPTDATEAAEKGTLEGDGDIAGDEADDRD